ncbi:hypothetical protein Mgra_00002909 [Meloidogyne graminicola]|uniref:Uncharacterized protein n=1 Tax=Meloidogyne graminicola TaxID=189291 RepID=A0A8S9ZXH8_9BILA|nr:hypothetical protein Mgra_00002909 [Meloidogyne graminicola]
MYYFILIIINFLIFYSFALKCKMALISNELSTDVNELSNKKILSQLTDVECEKEDKYCITYTEISTLNVTENFLLHSCESLWNNNIKKSRLKQGFESELYNCESTDGETHGMSASRILETGIKVSGKVKYSLNCCNTDFCNVFVLSGEK